MREVNFYFIIVKNIKVTKIEGYLLLIVLLAGFDTGGGRGWWHQITEMQITP